MIVKTIQRVIMAGKSKIEWTEYTWNPVTGCRRFQLDAKIAMHTRSQSD